jgi:hypothetical protein
MLRFQIITQLIEVQIRGSIDEALEELDQLQSDMVAENESEQNLKMSLFQYLWLTSPPGIVNDLAELLPLTQYTLHCAKFHIEQDGNFRRLVFKYVIQANYPLLQCSGVRVIAGEDHVEGWDRGSTSHSHMSQHPTQNMLGTAAK